MIRFPDFKPHSVTLELDGIGFFIATLNEIYPGDLYGTPSLLLTRSTTSGGSVMGSCATSTEGSSATGR